MKQGVRDGEVLPGLPRELLLDVLSRLPWPSNLRLRSVSKLWNLILKSPEVVNSNRARSISQECAPCLISTDGYTVHVNHLLTKCGLSDSHTRHWRQVPLRFPTSSLLKVVVATGGYFLVRTHIDLDEHGQYIYFLFDPIYQVLKKVPAVPSPELEGVFKPTRYVEVIPPTGTVSITSNSVKLVLVERFSIRQPVYRRVENWRIYCYDYVTEELNLVSDSSLPPLPIYRLSNEGRPERQVVRARFLKVRNVALIGEDVFILARPDHAKECGHNHHNAESCMDHRYGHVLFKAVSNSLLEISLLSAACAPFAQLFQHRGHLYLATGQRITSDLPFQVNIWKYDMGYWERAASMPEQLVGELAKKMMKTELFRLETEGDYVCFSRWIDSEVFIIFNLVTRKWKLVKFPDFCLRELDQETVRSADVLVMGIDQHNELMESSSCRKISKKKYGFRSCLWQPKLYR